MTLDATGYPIAPLTTSTASKPYGTQNQQFLGFSMIKDEEILIYNVSENASPLFSTLTAMGMRPNGRKWDNISLSERDISTIDGYKHRHIEEEEPNRSFDFNAAQLVGDTVFLLTSNVGIIPGVVYRIPRTNEMVRVTSLNVNGVNITVVRSTGTQAAAAILATDTLEMIANGVPKGIATTEQVQTVPDNTENYVQKIVTTMSVEDYDNFIPTNPNMALREYLQKKTREHSKSIEYMTMFGQKAILTDPTTNKPVYLSDGVIELAKRGWTDDIAAGLTATSAEKLFRQTLKYGHGDRKLVMCGTDAILAIRDLFENRIQVVSTEEVNLRFDRMLINAGEIMFVEHPYMDVISGYNNHALVLDPQFIKIAYPKGVNKLDGSAFSGRTRIESNNTQSNWATQEKNIRTYMTYELANPRAHGLFKISNV